jgi:ABC-type transport system involved in multi-copper enzyme maturation permease subunit
VLLGPVFRSELVRAPRRRHYFSLRVVYGMGLLLLLRLNFDELLRTAAFRGGLPLIDDYSRFAENTFIWFASVQLGTILFLVPALFGGVIADEKQRKTMHYLMASRLSSAEIVLDKLAARLLHVGTFILLGLPVMSLLTLFGGVALNLVAGAYLETLSITFFAASLSILISTVARRVRQGVLIAYVFIIAWLIVPPLADSVTAWLYPNFYQWFGPVNDWALNAGPLGLMTLYNRNAMRAFITPGAVGPSLLELSCWMVGMQVGLGLLFIWIAARRLRPIFRRQEESRPRLTWFGSRARARAPRWLKRPECGADAMLWKERHFARTDVFTKLVILPATIILTVTVILGGRFDETVRESFVDVWSKGYGVSTRDTIALNTTLRYISPLYLTLWLLAVAGAAASSVSFEREQDTWDSLVSTPLSGWEILRGKSVGVLWGLRGFAALLSLFWIVGLAAGAVHPFGLLVALGVVAILTWFVIGLGTLASLVCKKTSRALTATITILLLLNVGYLVVLYPIALAERDPEFFTHSILGCTPVIASYSLLSYPQVGQLIATITDRSRPSEFDFRAVGYSALVLLAYVLAAGILTWRSVQRFDRVVDRPRREGQEPGLGAGLPHKSQDLRAPDLEDSLRPLARVESRKR